MTLGIVSILLHCVCVGLGLPFGITAIITGIMALNRVKEGTGSGKEMAVAGLVCGIIAVVLAIGLVLCFVLMFVMAGVQGM